ncbi:MAG: N-acetylglucosamine-6-sulfatase [Solirubrobacteraceae bacterium]|nr:N-acetylglucosamine-6-sulfatase [Solirubrobacteraceae bacterium]
MLAALAAGCAAASAGHVKARRPHIASAGTAAVATPAPFPGGLPHGRPGSHSGRPNIVFVLTDDLSMDLLRFMPQVQALQARGMNFANYFVSDSLCCPSRSSIFTGNFPHDTGVFTNTGADGGISAFFGHGNEQRTFNLALERAGYSTALMGKYLNGYLQGPTRSPVPSTYVPPGWSEWDVAGWGYPEFNYELNQNGSLHHYGHRPQDYLTTVLARRGVSFINRAARSGQPFFLEMATFAPHSPYTPAPRDVNAFPGLRAPRPPNFDVLPTDPPSWLAGHPPLGPGRIRRIDAAFRHRVQAVQGVDAMLGKLQAALADHKLTDNTYVVFSSDNGLHTGEHRLMPGKLTAFDTDIHVPLVIAGPRIPADATTNAMTENVDLAKTFSAIGGTALPSDGHSLVDLLQGAPTPDWRNAVLIEHHGSEASTANPDAQTGLSGNPNSYEAMRTRRFLYVEYDNGEREFYDLQSDRYELHNLAAGLDPQRLALLHEQLAHLRDCHTGSACWAAGHVGSGG